MTSGKSNLLFLCTRLAWRVSGYIGRAGICAIGTTELADPIYLDHAATTQMLPQSIHAVTQGMLHWANPSSPHAVGRAARGALEDARARVAAAYGWGHEVIFTSGASEALHMALARSMAPKRYITAVDHDSVLRHAEGAVVLPVGSDGVIDLEHLAGSFVPGSLLCAQWANSETGVRQPIAAIAEIVHRSGGKLLVDAAQMPARADPAVMQHADLVAVSAHKRGGPSGIGALFVRDFGALIPMGGQEKGYRAGTENLPGAMGFAAAVEVPEQLPHLQALRAELEAQIVEAGGEVVGADRSRSPLIGAYRMPGVSAAAQLIRFDMAQIFVSAGSACSSGSMRPSHVLTAMGWTEPALREVVRVSFGRATSQADVDGFIKLWREILDDARRRAG